MANINTLKALYQPLSAKGTQTVLADVSQQEKDMAMQKQYQQKTMKTLMSLGAQFSKDYKGMKLAQKSGFGVDTEALKNNPEYEKHIRQGNKPEDFNLQDANMPKKGIKENLKDLFNWRNTTDVERKAYHENALSGKITGTPVGDMYSNYGFNIDPGNIDKSTHAFDVAQDSRNRGEEFLDEQYKRIQQGGLGAFRPESEPPPEDNEFIDENIEYKDTTENWFNKPVEPPPEDNEFTDEEIKFEDTDFDQWGDWEAPPRRVDASIPSASYISGQSNLKSRGGLNYNLKSSGIGIGDNKRANQEQKMMEFQNKKFDSEYEKLNMSQIIPQKDWENLPPNKKYDLLNKYKKQINSSNFKGYNKQDISKGLQGFFKKPEKQFQKGSNQYAPPEDFYKDLM